MVEGGEAREMASRTDEQSGARRITLLCWLLVLIMAAAAEGAWVLWLQDHWTADAHTAASPPPHLRVTSSEDIANGQSP